MNPHSSLQQVFFEELLVNRTEGILTVWREAREALASGRIREAKNILAELCKKHPDETAVHLALAALYWVHGHGDDDAQRAAECFTRATQLNPSLEIASLGLFHALWSLGKQSAAFDEMRRFRRVSQSDEYERLIAEMTAELTG